MNEPTQTKRGPRLSVVIPAYNEEKVLLPSLEKIHRYLSSRNISFEILPVDDGSLDRTNELALDFAEQHPECRPLRNPVNRGKGHSVRHGIEEARGEVILFSDADLSTPIEETEKFLDALDSGADVVIGSRDLPGSDVRVHQPWYRETMGRVFNRIVRMIVIRGIVDTQCGFKAFRRSTILPLLPLLRIERYSFDVEMLFVARRRGLEIREIPVIWINCIDTRVDALRDSIRMFVDLLRIRYYHLSGRYRLPPRRSEGPAGKRKRHENRKSNARE